jgi:hypothetical protein
MVQRMIAIKIRAVIMRTVPVETGKFLSFWPLVVTTIGLAGVVVPGKRGLPAKDMEGENEVYNFTIKM